MSLRSAPARAAGPARAGDPHSRPRRPPRPAGRATGPAAWSGCPPRQLRPRTCPGRADGGIPPVVPARSRTCPACYGRSVPRRPNWTASVAAWRQYRHAGAGAGTGGRDGSRLGIRSGSSAATGSTGCSPRRPLAQLPAEVADIPPVVTARRDECGLDETLARPVLQRPARDPEPGCRHGRAHVVVAFSHADQNGTILRALVRTDLVLRSFPCIMPLIRVLRVREGAC
jgi:hypothetical protein